LNKQFHRLLLIVIASSLAATPCNLHAQTAAPAAPVLAPKRAESRRQWYRDAARAVQESKRLRARGGRAKNVILFVGDGMGVATVTAARILEGQQRGASGEENLLSFERLPYVALSKTYSANQQTSDSAPTMTAIITGVKSKDGTLSVAPEATPGDHTSVEGNAILTLLERGERAGLGNRRRLDRAHHTRHARRLLRTLA
jgi:alkaline phosphatase